MRVWVLMIVSCALAGCGAVSSGSAEEDKARWQGRWKMVSTIWEGAPQSGNLEWVVDGDHYATVLDGRADNVPNVITLNAARKQVDIFHHDTPPGTYGGKLKGIYEVSGNTLRVCYDLTGQHYPKSFDVPRGSRQVVYEFRRE